tara:strand:- start:15 stop:326 length:312 start_codon:yes stop_codon:yes gene_type:complete
MHYILGTQFTVNGVVRGASSPEVLMANRGARLFNETGNYELFYIRPRTDSNGDRVVTYTFRNLENGNQQNIDFKTTKEADNLIATLLREDIPDYTKIYEEMSD